MRTPFVAFGTGRCGTTSLYAILDHCNNTTILKEQSPYRVNWYDPDMEKLKGFVRFLKKEGKENKLAGSVARYWLPHIEWIRKQIPEVKLICMHRDKKTTTESWMRWKGKPRDRLRPGRGHMYDVFPIIDAHTIQQSYEFYWDMYEEWSRSIEGVYHVDLHDLNDRDKITAIFDYLEIPQKDRKYLPNTKHNES